jgi:hypothetical protein
MAIENFADFLETAPDLDDYQEVDISVATARALIDGIPDTEENEALTTALDEAQGGSSAAGAPRFIVIKVA